MDDPHIAELRRTLLDFPHKWQFHLNAPARADLRRALLRALTCDGKYLDWFFPALLARTRHLPDVYRTLHDEAEWSFAKYDAMVARERDPHAHNNHPFHSNSPCARIFRKGEPIYKCLTCGFDDTCALCSHCYQPHQHVGHAVHVMICQRENAGVCDCGDPEAWLAPFACKYAAEDGRYASFKARAVPADFRRAFTRIVGLLLDYVVDVMCQSDLHFQSPWDAAGGLDARGAGSTLDPQKYGYAAGAAAGAAAAARHDPPSDKFCLIAYNDQIRHFRDAVQRIHLASKKVPEFATMVAEKIQSHGRATVIRSKDVRVLAERQKILGATGLASCIRNARDEVREDMCHEILLFLANLTEREAFKSNDDLQDCFCSAFCCRWQPGLARTDSNLPRDYVRGKLSAGYEIPNLPCLDVGAHASSHWKFAPSLWETDSLLSSECDYNQNTHDYEAASFRGSRFQYMVYLDIRFWKSIRTVLHDFYSTSLITNLRYKRLFSAQYIDIYPAVADMFLTIDNEPEVNILFPLSSQLFTCPSNSNSIIVHGDVSRVFVSIYNFLRTGQVKQLPTSPEANKISMLSLKNRRWGQIFFDIGYIISRGKDKELIMTNSIIPMACDILSLFQGKPTMKREKENHVEYENSDYTAFFHAISVIYQFSEYISQSTTNLERGTRQSVSKSAIAHVAKFLLSLETLETSSPEQNDVDYGLTHSSLVGDYMRGGEKASFLHPVHSFLSWLVQYANLDSADEFSALLREICAEVVHQKPVFKSVESCLSVIFHYPLQTAVLSSQVKSGFWVRNGFSIRSQLQLYKNTNLREHGYMRDMFMIQLYNLCSEPDVVMSNILRKWLLFDNWIGVSSITETPYEKSILPYIIEESASFFIHLLTEDIFFKGYSTEEITILKIRSEIIHNLCFGPLSYSKLCSQIPEHVCLEKKFDMVLDSLTIVKTPKGPRETSVFFLKEEYMDDVNPYYFIYTTNKKEDAIKFNKERIHKKHGKKICDAVIKPKARNTAELGIYKHIGNFTTSAIFREYLIKNLIFISQEEHDNTEGLLDTTLHLIHICAIEELIDRERYCSFFERVCQPSPHFETSLAILMSRILSDEKFKNHHPKIRVIMAIFKERYSSVFDKAMHHIPDFNPQALEETEEKIICESEEDRKKRLAKERQAKLLAKFKKQQKSFSSKNNISLECSDAEMEDPEVESGWKFPEPHCILCQDTASSAGPFGIITHVSKSSEFRDIPFDDKYWFLKAFSDKSNLNESDDHHTIEEHHSDNWHAYMDSVKKTHVVGPGFSDQKHVHSKLVSSTCGHGMHFNCYMQYLASSKLRQNQITRNTPESVEHREFLCPLCKSINNMFIPILWSANDRSMKQFLTPHDTEANPFDTLNLKTLHDKAWFDEFRAGSTHDLEKFSILTAAAKDMIGSNSNSLVTDNQRQFRLLLTNMFQTSSLLTFPQILKADSPDTLVNSIKSLEISVRGISSSSNLVIHHISNNSLINLRALNEFRITSLLMKTTSWVQSPSSHPDSHIKILAHLQALSSEYFNNTILHSDFFKVLVDVFPFPSTPFDFNSILRNCLFGCILQNLNIIVANLVSHNYYVTKSYSVLDIPHLETVSEADAHAAGRVFRKLRCCTPQLTSHEFITEDPAFGKIIYTMLVKSLTPFLRQAALYAYVCCANTDEMDSSYSDESSLEANLLCAFLKIPSLSDFLARMLADGPEKTWESARFDLFTTHIQCKATSEEHFSRKAMEYPGLVRTIELPDRLDQFFTDYYYSDKHQSPYLTIDNPAVCLFCSAVMDAQKAAIGSSSGRCTAHYTKECISSVGMFILPKERCLLLLHKNGGTFYDAPYIDQHGEIPTDNKKGKAVRLSQAKYGDFIREIWLQHNVPNLIVRRLESVIDAGGWNTL